MGDSTVEIEMCDEMPEAGCILEIIVDAGDTKARQERHGPP